MKLFLGAVVIARHLRLIVPDGPDEGPTNTSDATTKKLEWIENMNSVNKQLFSIACRFKHKTDVQGAAQARMRAEGWKEEEFHDFLESVQSENVETMKKSCGLINAESWKKCRERCSRAWDADNAKTNIHVDAKVECVNSCEKKHDEWETACNHQADQLQSLYTVHNSDLMRGGKCQNVHCRLFPEILTVSAKTEQEEKTKMEAKRDENCKLECDAKRISARCERQFLMEKDYKLMDSEESCHRDKQSELDTCQEGSKTDATAAQETCDTEKKGACDTSYDDCVAKGDDKGKAFCTSRKQMCYEQVTADCIQLHKKQLEDGADTCLSTFGADKKACVDTKIKEVAKASISACEEEQGTKCPEDCKAKCNVDDLRSCLSELEETAGATVNFCNNLWDWLYASEEVDHKTGNPVA